MQCSNKKSVTSDLNWKNLDFDEHFHPDLAMHWFMAVWSWLIQSEARNFWQLFINQPFVSYHIVEFASTLFRNVFPIPGEVKISSSMQYHVFSMLFSTIFECFATIKFWLLYMKENIKLCIWLRKCWNFRRTGMKYCWHMASTKNIA